MGEALEPPLLNIGEKIAHFEVTDYLGAGGMGEVYQATDGRLGRTVAIKVLRPEASEEEAGRFEREARTAAALQHPNIVTVHDVGETPRPAGTLRYLVMEYIDGASLRSRLSPQVDARRVLGWVHQVAEGLAAAHRAHVIHRDLKPENIMITADGQAKIVDFGLAKYTRLEIAETGQTVPRLTKRGQLLGTYHYMSPEQTRAETVDYRSDIFSFGTVLFEAIEGRQPFVGGTVSDLLREIRTADPEVSATGLVRDVITRCLRKTPADRYQSAEEIARDLRLVLERTTGLVEGTHPPSELRTAPVSPAVTPPLEVINAPGGQDTSAASLRAELRAKLKRAERLYARDEVKEAHALMDEVYEIARARGLKVEQLEVVLNRGFIATGRSGGEFSKRQLHEAEKLVRDVTTPWHKIEYYRLKSKVLRATHAGQAEKVLQKAIGLSQTSGEEDVAHAGILARCDYIHLLCNDKRFDDAREHVLLVEPLLGDMDVTRSELLVPIAEACIHFAIASDDLPRLQELLDLAVTLSERDDSALAFAHALLYCANGARSIKARQAATACADTAERLGYRAHRADLALAAAYTAAGALAEQANFAAARERCLRLVDVAKGVDEPKLRLCVMQLLSMSSRQLGDKSTAVDAAQAALREANGDAFGVCLAKMALAEALRDCGRVTEATTHARDVLGLSPVSEMPAEWLEETLLLLTDCCARIGDFASAEQYASDLKRVMNGRPHAKDRCALVDNRIHMHRMVRESLTSVTRASDPLAVARTVGSTSVQIANARLVEGLMDAWREYPRAAAATYDYWGRGNFARAMLNMQAFPGTLNLTIEVHTVTEARQAVRLWALLADVLILIWKGPTISSRVFSPVPPSFDTPGGNGYIAALIEGKPADPSHASGQGMWKTVPDSVGTFVVAAPHASLLPDDLVAFLVGEASALVARGRLIVVPSTGVCCIGAGHGPAESLLAEACNAIPVVRGESPALPTSWVPYFPDVDLHVLADVVEEHEHATRRLRSLLMRKSRELRLSGGGGEAKELELNLHDAVAHFSDAHAGLRRKHGWASTTEGLAATYDGVTEEDVAPILLLRSMGYRWRVESGAGVAADVQGHLPKKDEPVGTWLSPPDSKPNFIRPEDVEEKPKRRRRRR